MSVTVVCGTNWGDEGKGRMVDYLTQDADIVVRYQGGNNAGHTIVNEFGTFKLHLIPSGICYPEVKNVLGPGMVIDLESLTDEIQNLNEAGIDTKKIYISNRATICFPFHRQEDVWEEERLGKNAFGSTRRGIAPAYGDRYMKKAIQVGELLHWDRFKQRLSHILEWKNLINSGLYHQEPTTSYEEILDWSDKFSSRIKKNICDTTDLLEKAIRDDKSVLFEAQLGALRDIYHGIYPFTTSSSTLAGFAPIGGGLFSRMPERIVGVMKAFSTCVGEGPFLTEITGTVADQLRETAQEYGATTGRPRRIGYFDAFASHYGASLQNATEIALTKLDSLSGQEKLLICTHYEVNGQRIQNFPLDFANARPVYVELPGWTENITNCRNFDALPANAQNYVLTIEELIRHPIRYVSVGPDRHQIIDRK
jgi:adenylosuccinate synthase